MREALAAARELALLAYDAETVEGRSRRLEYHQWRRHLQAKARRVEKLTHGLGITAEPQGEGDGNPT